jgi:hypothetical protein
MPPIEGWDNFYVIVGSSAAALTGLQFVVVALVVDVRKGTSLREMDAFATPTIVHFCAVLLTSAILSAPWPSIADPTIALAAVGAAGVVYVIVVIRRSARQTGYTPVLEDRVFHHILPLVSYGVLAVAALLLRRHAQTALFWIGATTVLLLVIGIHNAWDTVTWIASGGSHEARSSGEPSQDVRKPGEK